jgi:Glycosyltransferase
MKIVVISSWFSEKMGYSENIFPKALARLGHEVHVLTSTAQVYYNSADYEKTYAKHLGPPIVQPGEKDIYGYTLHRLNFTYHSWTALGLLHLKGIHIDGLENLLIQLKPDVIQVVNSIDEPTTYQTALYAQQHGKRIFTESHLHASVIRRNNRISWKERLLSTLYSFHPRIRFINDTTALCYPIAIDVEEIARSLFHVPPSKLKLQPLGVDTEIFCPISTKEMLAERENLRASFGFRSDDLVCIYTGRFSRGKNPQLLAEAIDRLQHHGEKIFGLFIGNGTEEEIQAIRSPRGCVIHPFVATHELPQYYRSADIGVWPLQESTSQLDAAACGLPLILSNRIQVNERIDGNGIVYDEGDAEDLANKILQMKDSSIRNQYTKVGIEKIDRIFSWNSLAKQRIEDYKKVY